jgi:hypothetical protein
MRISAHIALLGALLVAPSIVRPQSVSASASRPALAGYLLGTPFTGRLRALPCRTGALLGGRWDSTGTGARRCEPADTLSLVFAHDTLALVKVSATHYDEQRPPTAIATWAKLEPMLSFALGLPDSVTVSRYGELGHLEMVFAEWPPALTRSWAAQASVSVSSMNIRGTYIYSSNLEIKLLDCRRLPSTCPVVAGE